MICPHCGLENLPGSSVCENCSSALTFFKEKMPVTKSKIEKSIIRDCLDNVGNEKSIALIVTKNMTVKEVIELMFRENKFSAVIMEGDSIEGIFTEPMAMATKITNKNGWGNNIPLPTRKPRK